MNSNRFFEVLALLPGATAETLVMTLLSTVFSALLGFPLGALLYVTSPVGIAPRRTAYNIMSRVVNLFRAAPFIILMILLIPLTRLIVGTSLGPLAVVVPLSIGASPFVARVVEAALREVDSGVILAARAMGATGAQILLKALIPESLPALVSGLALTIITLIGYSAMAGVIGGGGLGALAINWGYYRFRTDVTVAAVIVILILVELVQFGGNFFARKLLSRR